MLPDTPKKVLLQYVHPAHQRSKVNRALLEAVSDLPGLTFNDLYDRYPDFDIDVGREQALIEEHDVVVIQHPFFWYSVPALYREWQDLVLTHGWAYGHAGKALAGKSLMHAVSTGGSREAYCAQGYNRFTVKELLRPYEQTARLCGMNYLEPFVVHGTHLMSHEDRIVHALRFRERMESILRGSVGSPAPSAQVGSQVGQEDSVDGKVTNA